MENYYQYLKQKLINSSCVFMNFCLVTFIRKSISIFIYIPTSIRKIFFIDVQCFTFFILYKFKTSLDQYSYSTFSRFSVYSTIVSWMTQTGTGCLTMCVKSVRPVSGRILISCLFTWTLTMMERSWRMTFVVQCIVTLRIRNRTPNTMLKCEIWSN